jgi:CheY-like chemotaxis protein
MEDNPYNQEVNRKFLMQLGITASVACNGLEGVKIYKEKGEDYFDFIISDLDMPVMDGFAACKEIRSIEEQHNWHQCPIAVLTGHANDAMRIKCVNEEYGINAFRFFPKPVLFEAFKEMAEFVSNMKQQGVELALPSMNPEFGVLVADDDAFNRKLMSDIISKFNCKVYTASNGRVAFEEYLKNQKNIFLVLMDCEMPVMNGIDSTRMILESEKQRVNSEGGFLVKILGLTGFCDEMTKKRCLENGMIDVITKPIDINTLKDLIEKYRRLYLSQFR